MTRPRPALPRPLHRFARAEDGASLAEFALVVLFFLFLVFAAIDFGRLAHTWAATQKATQIAARIASVRPPACANVPTRHERGTLGTAAGFGTLCRAASGTCALPAPVTCTGSSASPTAAEIFARIAPLLPPGTTAANLRFTYSPDPALGFLGGPYVPMVTVELERVDFVFVSNLGRLIAPLTGRQTTLGTTLPLPAMSVSVPGEDLAAGTAG